MINSGDLLVQARRLLGQKQGAPRQIDLRRAISCAYYALFHHLVRSATDQIVARSRRKHAEYRLVYRSFDHATLRNVCNEAKKPILSPKLAMAGGLRTLSQDLRDCLSAFIDLQESRHIADYDPQERFSKLGAMTLIAEAEDAIKKFDAAPADEIRAIAYLFSFRLRQ